jgi:hypothetical protein
MTGLLIVLAAVALLMAALTPAHRRSTTPFRPGADLTMDRDHQRVSQELTVAAQRQMRGPRRVARLLAAAGGALPFHRPAPRLTAR